MTIDYYWIGFEEKISVTRSSKVRVQAKLEQLLSSLQFERGYYSEQDVMVLIESAG